MRVIVKDFVISLNFGVVLKLIDSSGLQILGKVSLCEMKIIQTYLSTFAGKFSSRLVFYNVFYRKVIYTLYSFPH